MFLKSLLAIDFAEHVSSEPTCYNKNMLERVPAVTEIIQLVILYKLKSQAVEFLLQLELMSVLLF